MSAIHNGVRDNSSSSWGTPFGGFVIGRPLTSNRESLEEYFQSELEYGSTDVKKYLKEFIDLECGTVGADSSVTATANTVSTKPMFYATEDTTFGGCEVLNPLYQFNEDDDIVPPINHIDAHGNGMGRVYSEMYRETQHILWMTFGVPRYNNLSRFYRQAYNKKMIDVMTSGDTSLSAKIGTIIGTGAGLAISLPLLPFVGIARAFDAIGGALFGNNIYKYYELKPAMHNYYKVVNTILATLCVHMNLLPNAPSDAEDQANQSQDSKDNAKNFPEYTNEELKAIFAMGSGEDGGETPDIIKHGADIIKLLSLRHTRRMMNRRGLESDLKYFTDSRQADEKLREATAEFKAKFPDESMSNEYGDYDPATGEFKLKADEIVAEQKTGYFDSEGDVHPALEAFKDGLITAVKNAAEGVSKSYDRMVNSETVDRILNISMGEHAYIGFRIERGSSVEESLSNSMTESAVGSKLKSMAQESAGRRFSLAGGGLGIGPLQGVVNAVDSAASVLSGMVGLSGLVDMFTKGSGYIDIPKVWGDSSFSKSYNFNIKLQSSYADDISIYQSSYIPLAMLMAACYPLGIGKNAYASPFLTQAYCKGMFSVPLGMISGMSIRRGDSENGWTMGGLPTVIDVSITIEDLSPMMFLSMTDKNLLEMFKANTTMQDYYATLAGVGLQERSNARKMMSRKWSISRMIWAKNTFNMSMLMHKIGSAGIMRRSYSLRGRNIRTGV